MSRGRLADEGKGAGPHLGLRRRFLDLSAMGKPMMIGLLVVAMVLAPVLAPSSTPSSGPGALSSRRAVSRVQRRAREVGDALHDRGQSLALGIMDHLAFHLSDVFYRSRAYSFVKNSLHRAVDWTKLRQLEDKYQAESNVGRAMRYFDACKYLRRDGALAYRLGLQRESPKSILDLGCGFGYFLLACQLLGHQAVGIDLEKTVLAEVGGLLGVRFIAHRIHAYRPLPPLPGEPFDVITASGIMFNNHNRSDLWGVDEWRFFLDDLARHARPGARVLLLLNRERTLGAHFSDRLYSFLRHRNALVCRGVGFVELTLSPPARGA